MNLIHLEKPLLQILNQAREVGGAAYGTLQVYNFELGGLQIVAQHGFKPAFLEHFRLVTPEANCVCGRALRFGKRVIVPDITQDPFFAAFLPVAQQAGFRGVQATPILDKQNRVISVLSTHYTTVCGLSHADMLLIDACASQVPQLLQMPDDG